MKFIIFIFLLTFTSLFALDITLVPYMEKSTYKNNYKQSSSVNGFYTKFFTKQYSLELNYEKTSLDYNSTFGDYKQSDYALAYSLYLTPNYRLKTAYHLMSGDSNKKTSAQIYFIGLQYLKRANFDFGVDLAYSNYAKSKLVDNVSQTNTYARVTFGDYKSLMGRYIFKVEATFINPKSIDSNSSLLSSYTSYGVSLKQFKGDFTNSIGGWGGEQVYALKDNGLTLYSLDEVHNSSYYISSRYSVSKNLGLTLSYKVDRFKDLDTTKNDTIKKYLLSLDYTIR